MFTIFQSRVFRPTSCGTGHAVVSPPGFYISSLLSNIHNISGVINFVDQANGVRVFILKKNGPGGRAGALTGRQVRVWFRSNPGKTTTTAHCSFEMPERADTGVHGVPSMGVAFCTLQQSANTCRATDTTRQASTGGRLSRRPRMDLFFGYLGAASSMWDGDGVSTAGATGIQEFKARYPPSAGMLYSHSTETRLRSGKCFHRKEPRRGSCLKFWPCSEAVTMLFVPLLRPVLGNL